MEGPLALRTLRKRSMPNWVVLGSREGVWAAAAMASRKNGRRFRRTGNLRTKTTKNDSRKGRRLNPLRSRGELRACLRQSGINVIASSTQGLRPGLICSARSAGCDARCFSSSLLGVVPAWSKAVFPYDAAHEEDVGFRALPKEK